MKIWLTTDTHFGHTKLVELCGRPENFTERIFNGFYFSLQAGDILIHLGDFCIGEDTGYHAQFELNTLGVTRWLVRGNHDRKSNSWYLNHGWHWVGESMELNMFDKKILFTHRPNDFPSPDPKVINIHGHLHNSAHRDTETKPIPNYHHLLALEYTNYQPVLLEKFIADSRKAQLIRKENNMSDETNTPEVPASEPTTPVETPQEETKE